MEVQVLFRCFFMGTSAYMKKSGKTVTKCQFKKKHSLIHIQSAPVYWLVEGQKQAH